MYKITVDSSKVASSLMFELNKQFKEITEKTIVELREATPVDTGAARDSWKLTYSENAAVISNDKDYLKQLNSGSSKQAPANFIENTLLNYGIPRGPIVTYE